MMDVYNASLNGCAAASISSRRHNLYLLSIISREIDDTRFLFQNPQKQGINHTAIPLEQDPANAPLIARAVFNVDDLVSSREPTVKLIEQPIKILFVQRDVDSLPGSS